MTRETAVLTLMLLGGVPGVTEAGQPRPPAPSRPAAPARTEEALPPQAVDERSAGDTRERLREIFQQYPPSVAQVLRLDPSLVTRPDYLAPYPTLASFLAQHPEVAHNPVYFLGNSFAGPQYQDSRSLTMRAIEDVFMGLEVLLGVVAGMFAVTWLARAAIEHRRWLRATKIQTDAHNKIVDRLSSNEDLLAYMQSTIGQHFLTASIGSAAIADGVPHIVAAPFNRILWSVQAGIVLAAAGLGLWFAKNGVIDEVAQPLQVVSILAVALGIGFVASAFASYALSQKLGLVQPHVPHA
jgi:hypothetical protein